MKKSIMTVPLLWFTCLAIAALVCSCETGGEESTEWGVPGAESGSESGAEPGTAGDNTPDELDDETTLLDDETTQGDDGEKGEGTEVTDRKDEEPIEEIIEEPEIIAGVPAPGSQCPFPQPWGTKLGEYLKNVAFHNCAGDDVTLYDAVCGASVGWIFFTPTW